MKKKLALPAHCLEFSKCPAWARCGYNFVFIIFLWVIDFLRLFVKAVYWAKMGAIRPSGPRPKV